MLQLNIGGLALEISSNSPELLERIFHRYGPAWFGGGNPVFRVGIDLLKPDGKLPWLEPVILPISFENGRILVEAPGYRGAIDVQARTAKLEIAAPNPVEASDYFLRVCLALAAHSSGGLLLHAAGIVYGGRAFLFFGKSGSGKTTTARVSPEGSVLNDDLILLRRENSGWQAHGTPFSNPTQIPPRAGCAPAAALLRLVQNTSVRLEPLGSGQALAELLASAPVLNAAPAPPLERCLAILDDLPAYSLHFLPDPSFWPLVSEIR